MDQVQINGEEELVVGTLEKEKKFERGVKQLFFLGTTASSRAMLLASALVSLPRVRGALAHERSLLRMCSGGTLVSVPVC